MIAHPRRTFRPHPRPNMLPPVAFSCVTCGRPAALVVQPFTCLCEQCGKALVRLIDAARDR